MTRWFSVEEQQALLLELLCSKIYPRYPELIRNDTKAARIVAAYIKEVSTFYDQHKRKNPAKLTRQENELVWIGLHFNALSSLKEESLRKHIRFLWVSGQLPDRIEFKEVKRF